MSVRGLGRETGQVGGGSWCVGDWREGEWMGGSEG